MKTLFLCWAVVFGGALMGEEDPELNRVIKMVLEQSSTSDVPFREVIAAVTGHQILPVDRSKDEDRVLIETITKAIGDSIDELNRPDSPARQESRINEVSRHFETALQRSINAVPDFACEVPKTSEGKAQSSGYPDLRIVHHPSGRVAYLDPKLVNENSVESSLRTFYYTPKTTTSKVLEDAHHLLVGIEHDGEVGIWQFTGWKLVDLYDFRVRLKAEYQASNRDLYRDALILESK